MEDHAGHRLRLRQRFTAAGLNAFAPHEMLELLLTYAIPRRDVKPLARQLLQRFGSLHAVLQADLADLQAVDGIGENAAVLLALILPLSRARQKSLLGDKPVLDTAQSAADYCRALLDGERFECFYVIALDSAGRVLSTAQISTGDESQAAVYPRRILASLLRASAAQVIVAHNHPINSAQPSQADQEMTNQLRHLLLGVDIILYDHIIVGTDGQFSFRQQGLL